MPTKCYVTFYIIVILFPSMILGFPRRIRLGGLFEEDDPRHKAFVLSINAVNKLRKTTEDLANVIFIPDTELITKDVFDVSQSVCSVLGRGVVAVFGPFEKVSAGHVQNMCEAFDMPNIVARWDYEPERMRAINFYPKAEALATALVEMIIEFEWTSFTILYESTESLIRSNALVKRWDPKGYPVTIRRLGSGPNYRIFFILELNTLDRDILYKVKQSQEKNIVIDCSYEILEEVLRQCQQVGLLSDRHRVIVTNLELQTLDLEPYQYSGVDFTGLRLVRVDDQAAQKTFQDFLPEMGIDNLSQLGLEEALIFDAVQFFARAFKRAMDVQDGDVKRLTCDGSDVWDYGISLSNYLRTTELPGLTGLIKFDTNGFRSDFELDVIHLHPKGLKKIGLYNSTVGFNWKVDGEPPPTDSDDDIRNQTFRVLIALNRPFNMLVESSEYKVGNDQFEGFTIDIIHELSKLFRFNYTFIETDPDYGSIDPDGKWTGMIGALRNDEADLAITDLTITAERESAVDFSMPFLNIGISILYRKPTKAPPGPFSFLLPFSSHVWLNILGAYLFVTLLICAVGRMSPPEWENPDPCNKDPEVLENQWTLKNAFWFTMGTLMQQGADVVPIGMSTRGVSTAWAFFRLIMVYTYTANLASFLVVETIVKPIKSAEDLANWNGQIKYGAKKGGSTFLFFKHSNYSTYARMYKYMDEHADDVLMEDNDEGMFRVLDPDDNYAFFMESSSIQYIQQRICNLTQIGGLLDSKGYGIAMKKGSKYRNKLSTGVLHLQESGILARLQTKWWVEKRGGGECNVKSSTTSATAMTMEHVGGVFAIVIIGIFMAAFLAVFELLLKIRHTCRKHKLSFGEELKKEIKFIMKCGGSVRPRIVRRRRSVSTEVESRSNTPH